MTPKFGDKTSSELERKQIVQAESATLNVARAHGFLAGMGDLSCSHSKEPAPPDPSSFNGEAKTAYDKGKRDGIYKRSQIQQPEAGPMPWEA